MVPVDTYCNAKSLMVIKTMKRLHIQLYAHPYPLFSKVGRGVGDSEFYSKNFTLVKMEQQNISHPLSHSSIADAWEDIAPSTAIQ